MAGDCAKNIIPWYLKLGASEIIFLIRRARRTYTNLKWTKFYM